MEKERKLGVAFLMESSEWWEILNRHNHLAKGENPINQYWLVYLRPAACSGASSVAAGAVHRQGEGGFRGCTLPSMHLQSSKANSLPIDFSPF